MDFNWLWLDIDALSCMLTSLRLLFSVKPDQKNIFFSLTSYLLILACSWITFRVLFGYNIHPDPAECFINCALCLIAWHTKGNIAMNNAHVKN